jgi:hypothetical protein
MFSVMCETELGILPQGCMFESGTEILRVTRISIFPVYSMQSVSGCFIFYSKICATCLYTDWHQKRTRLQMDCSFTMSQKEVTDVYLHVDKGRRWRLTLKYWLMHSRGSGENEMSRNNTPAFRLQNKKITEDYSWGTNCPSATKEVPSLYRCLFH